MGRGEVVATGGSSAALARVRIRGRAYQVAIELAGRGLLIPLVLAAVVVALVLAFALVPRAPAVVASPAEAVVGAPLVAVDPAVALAASAAADAAATEHLVGFWVPQVASGSAADSAAYLPVHAAMVTRFGALLVSSDMFMFKGPKFWVDVVPVAFDSEPGALAWCAAAGLGNENCYAKLLTRDPSVTVTVMHQG
jgi:hypothetical protein